MCIFIKPNNNFIKFCYLHFTGEHKEAQLVVGKAGLRLLTIRLPCDNLNSCVGFDFLSDSIIFSISYNVGQTKPEIKNGYPWYF